MKKKKVLNFFKKALSSMLVSALLIGGITATDLYYDYSRNTVKAATLTGSGSGASVSISKNNINSNVLNDASNGSVTYYFNGSGYPFNQLNAVGASNNTSGFTLQNSASTTRELVGVFNTTKQTWSSTGGYTSTDDSNSPRYALNATSIWNGAGNLAKTVNISTGGQCYSGAASSLTGTSNSSAKVFFPSYAEYSANSTISKKVFSANSGSVWSRSLWGVYSNGYCYAWCVYSSGGLSNYALSGACASAPAFNLDLSKVLIARSASSGATATTSKNLSSFNANEGGTAVKFLALGDGSSVLVSGLSNGATLGQLLMGTEYTFDYTMTNSNYLSAIILDESGNIVNYGSLAGGSSSGSASIVIPSTLTSGKTYYLGLFDETRNAAYTTDTTGTVSLYKFEALNDYHTGITISANKNSSELSAGGVITAKNITANYTSYKDTLTEAVADNNKYVIAASEWEANKSATNSNLASSITIPAGSSGSYGYYLVVKDSTSSNGYWVSDILSVSVDSHTAINIINNNDENLSLGDTIYASMVSGTYVTTGSTASTQVSAEDIYVIAASDWINNKSKDNSKLAKEIQVPDDASGTFDYYIIVLDSTSGSGYWASNVQTVDCSENATGFDANTWYSTTDESTGIVWSYKLDGNGDIIGLYTKSNITKIVDSGGTLNIPAKVAGRTVVKIGGGDETTPVVPASESQWTSLSLPETVTTLNDFAFYQTNAQAQITIPSSVSAIGIKSFYQSKITGVKLSEMDGTIGSYAFGKTTKLGTVSIKGGSSGLIISSVAFADTSATDVTIKGNVELNKKAFRGNTSLTNINIVGNVSIGEGAFASCSAVTCLNISGTTNISSYAFDGLTSLSNLYLPAGTSLSEYSFNGLTSLTKLESDVSLPANSFANGGKVDTLILDSNVTNISHAWEGHSSSVTERKVYIKNENMMIEYYNSDSTFYSALGSSGEVLVYIPYAQDTDLGASVEASDGVLKLNGYTSYAHNGDYSSYLKGTASSVTFRTSTNIDETMENDDVDSLKDAESNKIQTGIDAYYNGMILTTKDLEKDKMTVCKMYGSEEGDTYASDDFYVIRTTDYNAESKKGNITEDVIKSYEPVTVLESDLGSDDSTGTISVTVVTFYETTNDNGETVRRYYSTAVSIRIEKYNAKSYIEQQYGSYEAIAERLVELDNEIAKLNEELARADVDSIDKLTTELSQYKQAYADVVKTLEEYTSNNSADSSGYFGTSEDESGNQVKVVYINGTPSSYEDTGKTDSDGNKIYKTTYDLDKDGITEEIYIVVKDDGVHVVDSDGNAVKDSDGVDIVYKDTLGSLQRKLAAQLASIKSELAACDDGLKKIISALSDAGITIDPDSSVDEYTQISNAVNGLASKVNRLTSNLSNANEQIKSYANALDKIYAQLTGSSLDKDDITGITNILNAIIAKVQTLQNDLTVANATVIDLQAQVNSAESKISQLQTELDSTKEELETAEADITKAQNEKTALEKQYQEAIAAGDAEAAKQLQAQITEKNAYIAELETTKATLTQKEQDLKDAQDTVKQLQLQIEAKNKEIAQLQAELNAINSTADTYKVTADVANEMFGLTLKNGATADEIKSAIQGYVQTMTAYKNTIIKIQTAVGSTNEGDLLVADVQAAVDGNSNSGTGTDDTVVNKNSASYKQGVEDGVASVDVSEASIPYKNGYSNGYNAGYSAGIAANANNSNGISSNNDALISQLTNLSSEIGTLTSKNTSLNNKVSSLEEENSSLNEQVSSLQDENASLQSQVSSLEDDVNYLSSRTVTSGATSSNIQEPEETVEEVEETENSVEEESLTSKVPGLIVASSLDNTMMNMGEYKSIELPNNLTKDSNQKATSNINDNIDLNASISSSNAASYSSLKVNKADTAYSYKTEKLNNAKKIVAYYADNLTALGNLGWKQLQTDSTNKDKLVSFDELMSVDFKPSATQLETIKAGDGARLTVSSDKFEDGSTYFIVHESETRTGIFDILLTRANGNTIDITVPDLSPVTIVKVSISDNNVSDQDTTTAAPVELEVKKDNSGKVVVMYVLIVVAIIALGALFILAKKRNNGTNPFKRR